MLNIDDLKVSLEEEKKQIIKGLSLSIMPMSFFWLPFVKGIGSNINVGSRLCKVRSPLQYLSEIVVVSHGRSLLLSWFDKLIKLNVQCVKSRQGGKLC